MGAAPPSGHYSVKLVENIGAPQPFFPTVLNPIGPVPRVDSKVLCESQLQVLARNLADEIAAHNLSRSHANHLLALLMTLERDLLKEKATVKWLNRKLDAERAMRKSMEEAAEATAFQSVCVPLQPPQEMVDLRSKARQNLDEAGMLLQSLRDSNPMDMQDSYNSTAFQASSSSDAQQQSETFFSTNNDYFEANHDYDIEDSEFEPEMFALSPVDECKVNGKYSDEKRKFTGSPFLAMDEPAKRRKY